MQNLTQRFLAGAQSLLGRVGLATPAAHCAASEALGASAWELGELRALAVLEPDAAAKRFTRTGSVTLLEFVGHGIRLWVSADGSQIHFVGGRQNMDLLALGLAPHGPGGGPAVIGPVERLRYVSTRSGERVEYEHQHGYEFGSDYSELPVLVYDQHERRMSLIGGVYRVGRTMGIVQ
jgi:hypothetical protein